MAKRKAKARGARPAFAAVGDDKALDEREAAT